MIEISKDVFALKKNYIYISEIIIIFSLNKIIKWETK